MIPKTRSALIPAASPCSASELLGDFDVASADSDSGFQTINFVSSLASSALEAAGSGDVEVVAAVQDLLLDAAELLLEFIDGQFINEDILRSQTSSLAFITGVGTGGGSSSYEASLSASTLGIASTIVSQSLTESGEGESLIELDVASNL
eukprot:scaffold841_cov203-Pinguiococcus_pyrenoidosus.AAC.1